MTDLSKSKNAIVSSYYNLFDAGGFESKEVMLEKLASELLAEVEKHEQSRAWNVSTPCLSSTTVGAFVLHVPIQYMLEDAKPKEVVVYNVLKEQLVKITKGESQGMILPALTDNDGNRMFTLSYVGPDV